jgi:hypothetical protein
MITAAIVLAVSAHAQGCDLKALTTARAIHEALGHRAVKIVTLASGAASKMDGHLSAYVDQSASFDLGAGDVGRPLGSGVAGAHALALVMKADRFQFLGWDYMDGPADACGKQAVTVDFIDTADGQISQVEFTFDQGRVVAAKGWQHSFKSGSLPSLPPAGNGG